MDRSEAVLRELNLYPQWVRRNMPAPVVAGQPGQIVEEQHARVSPVSDAIIPTAVDALTSLSPNPSPVNGRRVGVDFDWPELKQQIRDCSICNLRAGCTQTVIGVGDERADWLFVGEGPGADEDALGEPFVGESGKLLDNMLMAIKLKRSKNLYITNIVKCRPPGNRTPEADEIAACLPYLERQIALIQPKLIVALGKVASNALLGKDATIASLRGELHDYRGIPLIVTYHPAYLLRTPSAKTEAWQDLLLAAKTHGSDA
jgi:uracil-DNA glycosylase